MNFPKLLNAKVCFHAYESPRLVVILNQKHWIHRELIYSFKIQNDIKL
jgi:hypothetical protein